MAGEREKPAHEAAIWRALALATELQDFLDANGGPPEAGVHLELCRQRLKEELARERK